MSSENTARGSLLSSNELPSHALNDRSTVLSLLASRRSALANAMVEPGPSEAQLEELLRIAVRVPDHGKLTPWRFIVFEGNARADAGQILAQRWAELNPTHGEDALAVQRALFLRAPVVIAVVSRACEHPKIPVWEQVLSAGAMCQNIVIAATAMGLGCQWVTGWYAYDEPVLRALGVTGEEKVAGFIYLGTPSEHLHDRRRPDPAALTTWWSWRR